MKINELRNMQFRQTETMKYAFLSMIILATLSCNERCKTRFETFRLTGLTVKLDSIGWCSEDTVPKYTDYVFRTRSAQSLLKTEFVLNRNFDLIPSAHADVVVDEECPKPKKVRWANPIQSVVISSNTPYFSALDTIVTPLFKMHDSMGDDIPLSSGGFENRDFFLTRPPDHTDTFDFYFKFIDSEGTIFRDTVFNVEIHK